MFTFLVLCVEVARDWVKTFFGSNGLFDRLALAVGWNIHSLFRIFSPPPTFVQNSYTGFIYIFSFITQILNGETKEFQIKLCIGGFGGPKSYKYRGGVVISVILNQLYILKIWVTKLILRGDILIRY